MTGVTFSKSQVIDAAAIVREGKIRAVEGLEGTFAILGDNGRIKYTADRNGCTCPATVPCKHRCAVYMVAGDWKGATP